ncbi:MAG TPA: DUF4384 domain-containing protein [Gemmatimonadales bacterium]
MTLKPALVSFAVATLLVGGVHQPTVAQHAAPPTIHLTLTGPDVFVEETPVLASFTTSADAYVLILRIDTDGRLTFLYPIEPAGDTLIAAGVYPVVGSPASHATVSFVVDEYPGVGYLFGLASRDPLALEPFVRRATWNRHALFPGGRVRGDPYVIFAEIAERVLPEDYGDYGYDILPYTVGERYRVPRFTCYGCHTGAGYPWRDDYQEWCATFRVDILADLWSRFPTALIGGGFPVAPDVLPAAVFVFTRRQSPVAAPGESPSPHRGGRGAPGPVGALIGELIKEATSPDATRVGGGVPARPGTPRPKLDRRTTSPEPASPPPPPPPPKPPVRREGMP